MGEGAYAVMRPPAQMFLAMRPSTMVGPAMLEMKPVLKRPPILL